MGAAVNCRVFEESLRAFALRLSVELGATRVLLFGSRAAGTAQHDSDHDIIVVSPRFEGMSRRYRSRGLRQLWYEVGGDGPLDIICLSPSEFDTAAHGISLLAAVLPEAIDMLPLPVAGPTRPTS